MKKSHDTRRAIFFTAAFVAIICGIFLIGEAMNSATPDSGSNAPTASKHVASKPEGAGSETQSSTSVVTRRDEMPAFEYTASNDETILNIALDRAGLVDQDGTIRIVELAPPATPDTLGSRLSQLKAEKAVLPVAYEKENGNGMPRLVTSDIRVKMSQEEAEILAKRHRLVIKERPAYAPEWVIFSAAAPLDALEKITGIRDEGAVEVADVLLTMNAAKRALPNDTLIGNQWHLKASGAAAPGTDMNIENAWKYDAPGGTAAGVIGRGIGISIVDDGLQTNHPDLAANVNTAADYDWNGGDFDPTPNYEQGDSHGTACAGVAAARGNNSLGVSGTAPEATLVGLRLIAGAFTDNDVAQAMSHRPDIIQVSSNSWGPFDTGTIKGDAEPLALAALKNGTQTGRNGKGTIYVWAGGNGALNSDNSNYDNYANSIYTIAVGATDSSGGRSFYSEPGANLVICAPSNGGALGITTTDNTGAFGYTSGDYTSTFGGTSSATPAISGAVALMLEKNPNLGWRDVQAILIRTAKKINPGSAGWINNGAGQQFNHEFGAGLVDATAAVDLAGSWVNLGQQAIAKSTKPSLGLSIPDNSSIGRTLLFEMPTSNIITEHVTVTLNIEHSLRGDLEIVLTSPSGTESRLFELHNDQNPNLRNFTFSTVRNWGENSSGVWTLKIADRRATDNKTGGTLQDAELTVYGVAGPPINPAPNLVITSPTNGSVFSPGVGYTVNVTATDFNAAGNSVPISSVSLYENGALVGTDNSAPYSFARNPANATYTYEARATDPQGLTGQSDPVTVTVKNQTPVISSVTLNAGTQAYDDVPIVASVNATDPENDPITLAYKWQFSTDAETYVDTGITTATLPANPSNSSKLWRCVVTASDSLSTSNPFITGYVNLLDRPSSVPVRPGGNYTYQSGLVIKGDTLVIGRQAIIHEFSQGPGGGTSEWVEILTLQTGSLAGWTLSDESGRTLKFSSGLWDNVPAGTLIVVYNGVVVPDPLLPQASTDLGSGSVVVSSKTPSLFTAASEWPTLDNGGDALLLKNSIGTTVHGVSYGNSFFIQPYVGGVSATLAAYYVGQTDAGASISNEWLTTSGVIARTRSSERLTGIPASIFPAAVFSNGRYVQDFNNTPGPTGTFFPTGWTSYSVNLATTQTTNYDELTPQLSSNSSGASFNFGSRIGMIAGTVFGGTVLFDPGFIALALDNTRGLTGLQISYDIIKISEQAKKMELNLEYTTGNPGNTSTQWLPVTGGAHNSGNTPTGTVNRLNNLPLPAVFQDRLSPIYLRWVYRTATNNQSSGFPDALAIDNLIISSDSSPNIYMTLDIAPTTFSETGGDNASTGFITLSQAVSYDLSVNISSSDITEAAVPSSVVIPAGQLSANFAIRAVDDIVSDGPQVATISLSATGFLNVSKDVYITDNEPVLLGVTPAQPNNPGNANFVDRLRTGRIYEAPKYFIAASTPLPAGLSINSATGLISGTVSPTAALGKYTVIIETRNVIGGFSSQTIVIEVSNTIFSSYSQWISQFGSIDQSVTGNTDLDDLPNLVEYVLNSRPDMHERPSPVVSAMTPTAMSITYTKSKDATDVTLVAEWSPTMSAGTWSSTGITNEILVDGVNSQTIRSSVTIDAAHPAKFMRLKAVGPPP